MKTPAPRNLAASVSQRLLERSRREGEDHQYLLMRYGLERLMYRLGQSPHADLFVLKGAMMFLVWSGSPYRPTKDLDLLAVKSSSVEHLAEIFREVCLVKVPDDALNFLPATVAAEAIREDAAYQGVRVTLEARLGKIQIPLQVDIGFGDVITPKPKVADFPVLLDFPAPHLSMYSRETTIAEKFEAMVHLDMANSRMKDFYDIWVLSRMFEFDATTVEMAIRATFKRRKTEIPLVAPTALTEAFASDPAKVRQWQAFVKRGRFKMLEPDWAAIIRTVHDFLMPLIERAPVGRHKPEYWPKGGPWRAAE
ncbi:MAG: nucleotidyl transferase AbiEii/AbiGii toxin family protein [Formivibrio sp.]|nr:nucleotidyl transferase AbiEii/AbiGii toxin family protein [Formivibrio sp.]